MYSLEIPSPASAESGDVADPDAIRVDYRNARIGVRARDNEFLVGCTGEPQGMAFGVSFDGNVIDDQKVFGMWKVIMEGLLEEDKAKI